MLGCDVRYLGNRGYPPLRSVSAGGAAGGTVRIRGDIVEPVPVGIADTRYRSRAGSGTRRDDCSRDDAAGVATLCGDHDPSDGTVRRPTSTHPMRPRFASRPARATRVRRLLVEGDASTASYFLAAGVHRRRTGARRRQWVATRSRATSQFAVGAGDARAPTFAFSDDCNRSARRASAHGRNVRLQRDPGCRDDACRHGAVCASADASHRHRQLARQGNRTGSPRWRPS